MVYNRVPPENVAVSKGIDIARGDPEILRYLKEEHTQVVTEFKREDDAVAAATAIDETLSVAEYSETRTTELEAKLRNGEITREELEMLRPGYFNHQDLLVQQQLAAMDKDTKVNSMQNVTMIFDVNDKSEFVKGYVGKEGKQLRAENKDEKEVIGVYDQCLDSWLISNNLSSQGGVIYDATKMDSQGNYTTRANPDTIDSLITSDEKGLAATVQKQGSGLNLSVKRLGGQPQETATPTSETNM